MKSRNGSDKSQHSYSLEKLAHNSLDCPMCGARDSLEYRADEVEVHEGLEEPVVVEGMFCNECGDLFLNPEEGVRLLNEKAAKYNEPIRFAVVDDEIKEFTLH
jgi:C4-type Zn-finger protein